MSNSYENPLDSERVKQDSAGGPACIFFITVSIWVTNSKYKPSRDEATKKTNQPNWTYPNLNEFNALQFIIPIH